MSSSSQPTDLADLRTDLLGLVGEPTGSTAINVIADRYLNKALHDIHIDPGHNWPWASRRAYLVTHDDYTTGTVSITIATSRTAVTGVSTTWNTAATGYSFNNARAGGKIVFSGETDVYEVSSVTTDTALVLLNTYIGTANLSGASYIYYEDEYALAADFLRPLDMRNFSTDADIPFIGPMEFRRSYPRNSYRAKPKVATLFQLGFSGGTTPRYRVVLAPVPDANYSLPYDYITSYLAVSSAGTEQTQLSATTDEPIIPLGFRHIISLRAAMDWLLFRKDDTRYTAVKGEFAELMQRMAGTSNIGQDRPRIRVNIGKYFGPYRMGRFDVGDRFDDLRDRRWR